MALDWQGRRHKSFAGRGVYSSAGVIICLSLLFRLCVRRSCRCFFMRVKSVSSRVVRSALSAFDSLISGGFRAYALK